MFNTNRGYKSRFNFFGVLVCMEFGSESEEENFSQSSSESENGELNVLRSKQYNSEDLAIFQRNPKLKVIIGQKEIQIANKNKLSKWQKQKVANSIVSLLCDLYGQDMAQEIAKTKPLSSVIKQKVKKAEKRIAVQTARACAIEESTLKDEYSMYDVFGLNIPKQALKKS